jgi:hypothetical protein
LEIIISHLHFPAVTNRRKYLCSNLIPALSFRRFITAANPSVQNNFSCFFPGGLKPPQILKKPPQNIFFHFLFLETFPAEFSATNVQKPPENGSVGFWPPQILAGMKGNSCSVCRG